MTDPDTRWYDGKGQRLKLINYDHLLHAVKTYRADSLSVGIGCGNIGEYDDVTAYFDIRKDRITVPPEVEWTTQVSDESLLTMCAMQWDIVGDGYRALRIDILKAKSTLRPAYIDVYWLKGWYEGT